MLQMKLCAHIWSGVVVDHEQWFDVDEDSARSQIATDTIHKRKFEQVPLLRRQAAAGQGWGPGMSKLPAVIVLENTSWTSQLNVAGHLAKSYSGAGSAWSEFVQPYAAAEQSGDQVGI